MARKITKAANRARTQASDVSATIIFNILLIFVIVQPLIFLTFLNNFWDLSKSSFMSFTALAIFGVFVYSALTKGSFQWRRTPMDLAIPIALVVMALMTLFSSDISRSIFGEYRRYEGLITYISYAVIFFGAAFAIRTKKQVEAVFTVWMIPVAIASIYGIMQHFGHDIFQFSSSSFEINRSFGTMGNPIKFATFLAIACPILVYLYLNAKSQAVQVLAFGTLMLDVVANYFSFSRAGWISMALALIVFVALVPREVLKKKLVPVAIMFVALFAIVFFVNSIKSPLAGYDLGSRLSSISQTDTGSNAARLNVWSSALKMSADKPIAGFGLDTFRMNFPRYRQFEQIAVEGGIIEYDRPHNDTLQLLTSIGFVGLVFYFFMVFIPFLTALRRIFKLDDERRMIVTAAFSGIVAHIVSVQFSFTNVVLFSEFMILSAIIFLVVSEKGHSTVTLKRLASNDHPMRVAAIAFAVILSVLSLFQFIRMPSADVYYKQSQMLQSSGQIDQAVKSMEHSIALFPHETFYQNTLGQLYTASYQQASQINASADTASIGKAVNLYTSQIESHPSEKSAYFGLTQLYLGMGDYDNAISIGRMAVILDPYAFDALVPLGYAYVQKASYDTAVEYYERSIETMPPVQNEIMVRKYIAEAHGRKGDMPKVIEQLRTIIKLNSADAEVAQQLAILESEQGAPKVEASESGSSDQTSGETGLSKTQ